MCFHCSAQSSLLSSAGLAKRKLHASVQARHQQPPHCTKSWSPSVLSLSYCTTRQHLKPAITGSDLRWSHWITHTSGREWDSCQIRLTCFASTTLFATRVTVLQSAGLPRYFPHYTKSVSTQHYSTLTACKRAYTAEAQLRRRHSYTNQLVPLGPSL